MTKITTELLREIAEVEVHKIEASYDDGRGEVTVYIEADEWVGTIEVSEYIRLSELPDLLEAIATNIRQLRKVE